MISVSQSVAPSVVFATPVFETISEASAIALQQMADTPATATEERGEYFALEVAEQKTVANMRLHEVVLVPLRAPLDGQVADLTFLASSPHMFVKVTGTPQTFMTYGKCWAYSVGVEHPTIEIGANVKFASVANFTVAKDGTVEVLEDLRRQLSTREDKTSKRPRQLVEDGERGDGAKEPGTSTKYIVDLDGMRYPTRNKNDVTTREKNLYFLFRALDTDRWDVAMGADLTLQTEEYRIMIIEQGRTRSELRNKTFLSCGILDRVHGLSLFKNKDKLDLFLTGNVLVEGSTPTITLEDFTGREKITSSKAICPDHNRPLADVLRNLQVTMEILLSEHFEGVMDVFIADLEGKLRPLELVTSDFLRYSVEEVIKKFFRVVRSERRGTTVDSDRVKNPQECATFLKEMFAHLSILLSDFNLRGIEEAYFRRLKPDLSQIVRLDAKKSVVAGKRICSNHLGASLKATTADGAKYKCAFGSECRFRHIGSKGKQDSAVTKLIDALPHAVQGDLKKALKVRST